jgi:hypothetical protein
MTSLDRQLDANLNVALVLSLRPNRKRWEQCTAAKEKAVGSNAKILQN